MSWFDLIVGALLTARLSRLASEDTILDPWRDRLGDRADRSPVWEWIWDLVTCRWCVSIWIAAAVVAGWHVLPTTVWVTVGAVGAWSFATGLMARLED